MKKHKAQGGFTLIELLIVTIVLGILLAIAWPNYSEYVRRSHRANARAALQQAAQHMERVASAQGRYPTTLQSNYTRVEGGRYTITLKSDGITYTLTAVRSPTGGNSADQCGDLTLTNTNAKGIVNNKSGVSKELCWNR